MNLIKFKQLLTLSVGLVGMSISAYSSAENIVVGQKDKAFTQKEITIQAGDTVEFLNEDPYFHNVFSLSDTKLFDLGSYPEGDSRTVTFEEKGVVEVECAIHPQMVMKINVE